MSFELPFHRACLVVAHPDDEILWFSSVLDRFERIIICYLDNPNARSRGPARRRVLDRYPLKSIGCLGLEEPQPKLECDWRDPEGTRYGFGLGPQDADRNAARIAELIEALGSKLEGFDTIFTHNPWGEYGHASHVQVHWAVREITAKAGTDLWFPNYYSARTAELAGLRSRGPFQEPVCLATNRQLAEQIQKIYLEENCWTAPDDHVWAERECFNRLPEPNAQRPMRRCFDMMIDLDWPLIRRDFAGL